MKSPTIEQEQEKQTSANMRDEKQQPENESTKIKNWPTLSTKSSEQHAACWPRPLTCFDDIRVFTFFMCLIVMLTNALVVGYRNSVVTTIEKRYEFSSVFSGVLSGCLEFGSLIATLFVSYFFSKSHIPRCIAVGSLFCGIGALLYALPHLLWSDERSIGSMGSGSGSSGSDVGVIAALAGAINEHDEFMCRGSKPVVSSTPALGNTSQTVVSAAAAAVSEPVVISSILDKLDLNTACLLKPSNLSHFIILIIANVLIGSSSAPLYTLGTSYIDQHVEKNNSSVYLAFIYSMLAFGPLVGYLVGAAFLRVHVNAFTRSLPGIDPTHSSWIGAWYGGFVLFGVLIFLTAFPFFCIPRIIKKGDSDAPKIAEEEKLQVSVETQPNESSLVDESSFGDFKNLPKAMKRILSNKVFMIVTFGFCFEITIISGFMTFLPKYIEHQFDVDNSLANIYTGGVAIPGACVGIVSGGFIVKRLKINPKSASLMAIICNTICLTGIIVLLFMGCDNIKMAGTTAPYTQARGHHIDRSSSLNLTSECNAHCQCSTFSIEPICGSNGLTYFSPCHAGCRLTKANKSSNSSNQQIYMSCSCIQTESNGLNEAGGEARSGSCPLERPCRTLVPFLVILFFITLLTALNQMPMLMVTLRSVSEYERAFALGLQLVIMRILAYIPSPLIFGSAIDWTCLVWRRDECDKTGSCLLYDRDKFRNVYGSIGAIYKAISLVLFILLFVCVRKMKYSNKTVEMSDMMGSSQSLDKPRAAKKFKLRKIKFPKFDNLKVENKKKLASKASKQKNDASVDEANKMITI